MIFLDISIVKTKVQFLTNQVLASIFLEQVKRIANLLRSNNAKFCFFQLSHSYPEQSVKLRVYLQPIKNLYTFRIST